MHTAKEAIERGLDLYRALVGEQEALESEFDESRAEYFAAGTAERQDTGLADRRHLEWFLLERPSETLGGAPAEALLGEWTKRAELPEADLVEAFLQSLAGAFEITSTKPGEGVWLRDLFGLGEYPIEEPEAAYELAEGDLLVGRIFPIGNGVFRLSPAVSCFRNPDLVAAVRADLELMRGSRRGVLRIQQIELERLFFSNGASLAVSEAADVPAIDLEEERTRAREELETAGLDAAQVQEVLEEVARSAREGRGVVTDVLNELAFSTAVDLERAQRALTELWAVECHGDDPRSAHGGSSTVGAAGELDEQAPDARTALEAFDRGRASGEDLEALFQQLAQDLGVDLPAEREAGELPDFPGVLGAMVEEFLWDVGRERGGAQAERLAGLRRLADYGAKLGVFEEFGRREVLDFAGRWLLDEGELGGPEEARAVLDALGEFARWCEERHAHPLATTASDLLDSLTASVPRLVVARQRTAPPGPTDSPWDVIAIDGEDALLVADDGREKRLRLEAGLAGILRAGDLVHARSESGGLCLTACYPSELRELLENRRGG